MVFAGLTNHRQTEEYITQHLVKINNIKGEIMKKGKNKNGVCP